KVIVLDYIGERLRVANLLGASETVQLDELKTTVSEELSKVDVVVLACDRANGFELAINILKPGGRLVVLGNSGDEPSTFKPAIVMEKSLEILGVISTYGFMGRSLSMITRGDVQINRLITHEFDLEDFDKAYRVFEKREDAVIRVAVRVSK